MRRALAAAAFLAVCRTAPAMNAYFEPNLGQAPEGVAFVGRSAAFTVLFYGNGGSRHFRNASDENAVTMTLPGANPRPRLVSGPALDTVTRYYEGSPEEWRRDISHHESIEFRGVYDGIDLIWRASDANFEFLLRVAPGFDAANFRFRFEGARSVALDEGGNLLVESGSGRQRYRRPSAWQVIGGKRVDVPARFGLHGELVTFETGAHDPRHEVIIDPVLTYSTFLGGSGFDSANAIAVDASGSVYLAGETGSATFPGVPGQTGAALARAAFVAKLSPDGSRVLFTTILAAGGNTSAKGVALDRSGNIWVAGTTSGSRFPVTSNALRTGPAGAEDAFIAKLDAAGNLVYATYLGGAGMDVASAVKTDAEGNVYVSGMTGSLGFPTTPGAPQRTHQGGFFDAFLVKIGAAGTPLLYSTLLGGSGSDQAAALAVDSSGNACIAGRTDSPSLPVQNAAQAGLRGNGDVLLACLNASGTAWSMLTSFGGSGSDEATAVAMDGSGGVVIAGKTFSPNLPVTPGAFGSGWSGDYDAFAAKFPAAGGPPSFVTYLGAGGTDAATAAAFGPDGSIWVAGFTNSINFPLASATPFSGYFDAFAARIQSDGSSLLSASLLGGSGDDRALAIAVMPSGGIVIAGMTQSNEFPVTEGAAQRFQPGNYSAFAASLAPGTAPEPVSAAATFTAGRDAVLEATVDNAAGAGEISILVNTSANAAGGCLVRYLPSSNTLELRNDAGSAPAGSVSPGSSASASNSQCAIGGAGSAVTSAGARVVVRVNVHFLPRFSGAKNIYVAAASAGGAASGWKQLGTAEIPGNTPPSIVSVSTSGPAGSPVFTLTAADPDGYRDISWLYLLVDRAVNGVGACFVAYFPKDNRLLLMNDAGTGWLPAQYAGGAGALSNSQCSISLAAVTAGGSGSSVAVQLPVAFSASFAGTKTIYASASDPAAVSDWRAFGAWSIPGNQPPRLTSVGMTPQSDGISLTVSLADDNGFRDVQMAYLLLDRRFSGLGACFLAYLREPNTIMLMNDAATAWSRPLAIGSGGDSVSNSQCTVLAAGSSVTGYGNSLALTVRLRIPSSFGGDKSLFVYAADFSNNGMGWIRAASVGLPGNQPPKIESVQASAGANGFTVVSADIADPNGRLDVETAYFLVDRGIIGVNACFLAYNRGSGVILLMNDAGTGWQGLVYPGVTGVASNSQCTIDGAASSFTETDSKATLKVALRLNPAFTGKSLFVSALDVSSASSGWLAGAWPGP